MIANVELTDGRVFQFASRTDIRRVLDAEPGADDVKVPGWLRRAPGERFVPLRVSFLRRGLIASIVDAEAEAGEFAEEVPARAERDRRAAAYRERESSPAVAA